MQFSGIIGMGRQTTQEECNDRYDGGFTDGRGSCQQTQSVGGDRQTSAQAKAVTWIQNQWAMAHQSIRLERLSHKAEKHSEIKKAGIHQHQSNSVAISLSSLAWTPSDNRPSFCYPFILSDCHLASQDQGKIDRFWGGDRECICMTQIYTLTDPRTNIVRYVGISENAHKRYKQHIKTDSSSNPKNVWIKELHALGLQPILTIIEEAPDRQTAMDREKEWVSHYAQKHLLTNFNLNTHAIGETLSTWGIDQGLEKLFLREMGVEDEQ
jgi:predicted GIY-YIG superfamily endonuclease